MKIAYLGSLYESIFANNLIVIDIQPDYESHISFNLDRWVNWINNNYSNYNSVYFLFNGPDLGFPSEGEYMHWLIEIGISEDIVDGINFFDKGHAFFRTCMDRGIDEEEIVNLVRYMDSHNIRDSRNMSEDNWGEIDDSEIKDMLIDGDETIFIPDLLDYVGRINGSIDIIGGAEFECMKEVEIALMVKNKPFNKIREFIY